MWDAVAKGEIQKPGVGIEVGAKSADFGSHFQCNSKKRSPTESEVKSVQSTNGKVTPCLIQKSADLSTPQSPQSDTEVALPVHSTYFEFHPKTIMLQRYTMANLTMSDTIEEFN